MADGVDVKFLGLPEFSTRLRALSFDMQRKIVRAGATAAGVIFRNAAIANAPTLKQRDTRKVNPRVAGTLKKSIYAARSKVKSKPGIEVIVIAARSGGKAAKSGKSAFYWRFVEAGHLARGRGQKVKGGTRRAGLERARLKASGAKFVPPVEFLKRAFKDNQDAAVKAFNSRIAARITKAQRELNER
jgi:HK97 gp10 family phage protein